MEDEENLCKLLNTKVKVEIEHYNLTAFYNAILYQCHSTGCQQCPCHSTPVTWEMLNEAENAQAEMYGKIVSTLFCTNFQRCMDCRETVQLIGDFESKEMSG